MFASGARRRFAGGRRRKFPGADSSAFQWFSVELEAKSDKASPGESELVKLADQISLRQSPVFPPGLCKVLGSRIQVHQVICWQDN